MPAFLGSVAAQTRPPDRLLLVDDGSRDGSAVLAEAFARRHDFATVLRRPVRPAETDRLATAAELRAFNWALSRFDEPWGLVAKLDADLSLPPQTLASVESRFRHDPGLGIAGPRLRSLDEAGQDVSHRTRPGLTTRSGQVLPARLSGADRADPADHLGWDTIDEVRARMRGWRTAGGSPAEDPVLHLRPMGERDGAVRARIDAGVPAPPCSEHPLYALAMGVRQLPERPQVVGGLSYVAGWTLAALRRAPRAEPELRSYVRRTQLRRVRQRLAG